MEKILSEQINSRPQGLCLMCGACCRVVTTPKTHEELLELAQNGDQDIKDFLNVFEPYSSIEEARNVSAKTVDNILFHISASDNPDRQVTFYRCKHLQDNNMCEIYQNRPSFCHRFPYTGSEVVPPGCGYEGWLFQKREEMKKGIRKKKEELIEYKIMLETVQDPEKIEKIKQIIEKIESIIVMHHKYGSKDW